MLSIAPGTPGNQSLGFPPRGTRISDGGLGGYFLLVASRRPKRRGSESSSVGTGLRVPSKAAGSPGYGDFRAASCTYHKDHIFRDAIIKG